MTMRTTIQRLTPTGSDDWGQPTGGAWAVVSAALPCFVWSTAERETMTDGRVAVFEDLRAIVPEGTDVTERDRLSGVTDRAGVTVLAGLFDIEAVIHRKDHLALVLRRTK